MLLPMVRSLLNRSAKFILVESAPDTDMKFSECNVASMASSISINPSKINKYHTSKELMPDFRSALVAFRSALVASGSTAATMVLAMVSDWARVMRFLPVRALRSVYLGLPLELQIFTKLVGRRPPAGRRAFSHGG